MGEPISGKADENIKHCKICDMCWEVDFNKTRNFSKDKDSVGHIYIYYCDFVTYGKTKANCPRCLGESS